jgi:hypothetical protein
MTRYSNLAKSQLRLRIALGIEIFVWMTIVSLATAVAKEETEGEDFFERHVRPILIDRCQGCHGESKQWAGLRLDSAEALNQGGENGSVIKPFVPEESELLVRMLSTDDSVRMPPPESGLALSVENTRSIREWIAMGAPWPKSIATKTAIDPSKNIDQIRKEHWAFRPLNSDARPAVERDVDAFLLAKLQQSGLSYSKRADRRTLIRRATYDLTGLPPTCEEVVSFDSDPSQDAYARLIDRLLDSKRYGEKWGRIWLDVARYSDTKGYVYAREERFFIHASLYRDWVIQAFNQDMPYDQFVLMQLAADCVAPKQTEALAAMGFLTVGRRFIGVTPDIMDDRIDVVCRGLMGLTVGCARCHDHKFDPIPTADYYSLYGVFQNSIEREIASLPSVESSDHDDFLAELHARQKKYDEYLEKSCREAEARFRTRIADYLMAQRELDKYPDLTFNQVVAKDDLWPGVVHRWESYLERAEQQSDPIYAPWIAFSKLEDDEFATKAIEISLQLRAHQPSVHPTVLAAFVDPPSNIAEVAARYGKILATIDKTWNELCEAAQRDAKEPPISMMDVDEESLRQAWWGAESPCKIPRESMANIEWLWDDVTLNELWKLQGEIERWIIQNPTAEPHYVALVDQATILEPRIFKRGNPAKKGSVVPRQFLAAVAGAERQPFQQGSGRLELARAIIDPANPLTTRVWVNRVWQNHFGNGLVETPSDFGLRASPPSHPELLDWLASQFIANGWSTRWLHRTMMLSEAYQQSSRTDVPTEIDPENRLLWRMNPRRLSFEEMRDTMVAVSDEIDWTMGGKAVDVFTADAEGKFRRAVYGLVDRQYLPTVFNVFDFANPDLHSPQRNETSVPQQALFSLNHPFVAGRARAVAEDLSTKSSASTSERVVQLFKKILQREPTDRQLLHGIRFVESQAAMASDDEASRLRKAWSYGYGSIDAASNRVASFERLPHPTSVQWQGGAQLPDAALGWVHIGPTNIHSGNDLTHSAIRRWTAADSGRLTIRSMASHEHLEGDGVRGVLISSRHGILQSTVLHHDQSRFDMDDLEIQTGDTIDFVVELHGTLHYEDLQWSAAIQFTSTVAGTKVDWDSVRDFSTSDLEPLNSWEQLAHVLLISNECMFVD